MVGHVAGRLLFIMTHSPSSDPPDSVLRHAWCWIMLPVVAWLVSMPLLGGGSVFVPIIIRNAPLGILSYFQEVELNPTRDQEMSMWIIHGFFWALLFTGITFRRKLPAGVLRTIWCVLAAALFMSVSGCAMKFGGGLRSQGNWH